MSDRFEIRRVPSLPRLAWLLECPAQGAPTLTCGSGVVCTPEGFFEGGWCGDFSDFSFELAANVFGSGAKLSEDGITLVTPSQNLESICYRRDRDGLLASNSLPFLMTATGDQLRRNDWSYGERFSEILNGVEGMPIAIPTARGEVFLLFHHNAHIERNQEVRIQPKPLPPPLPDFATYREYLLEEVGALWRNVDSSGRPERFRPLATMSSGYDSTAAASLAAGVGCKEAVSFRLARGGKQDSGEAAAAALGLALHVLERVVDGTGRASSECEFLAGGSQGEELFMATSAELVEGRLLFSGFVGGTTWTPRRSRRAPMARKDLSGGTLGEFRLRTGFVHFPPGAIGLPRSAELDQISFSEELLPWSIGGDYDRPIPRRLAEEAGVPREAFGHEKKAGSVHVFLDDKLWSAEATRAVEERLAGLSRPDRFTYRWRALRFRLSREYRRWASRFQQLFGGPREVSETSFAGRLFERVFGAPNPIVEHSHPRNTLLQDWALEELRERYTYDKPN